MTALPCWPAVGVTVTVRFVPLPPNTMLAGGTREVSDDAPDKMSDAMGIELFVIVNGSGPVEPLTGIVWSAMGESFGTKVPGCTKTFGPPAKLFATSEAESDPV